MDCYRPETTVDASPSHRAGAIWLATLVIALAGCDRLKATGEVPTYPDTKLEVMRSVTGADLPHDPHQHRSEASQPRSPAASASAGAAAGPVGSPVRASGSGTGSRP
jgi:hypothetical protein